MTVPELFSCLYYRQEEASVFFIFLCTCLLVLVFCSFYFSIGLFLGFFFWSCEGKLYKGGRCNKRYARCNPNSERYACVVWIWFDRNSRNGAKRFIHGDCKKFPFFSLPIFFSGDGTSGEFETRRFHRCNCTFCNASPAFVRGFCNAARKFFSHRHVHFYFWPADVSEICL